MAKYEDGSEATLNDWVAGKPEDREGDVCGQLIGVERQPGGHTNCAIAFLEPFAPTGLETVPQTQDGIGAIFCKPYADGPLVGLRLSISRGHTEHFRKVAGPANVIVVNGREFHVGHRVTGKQLKALAGVDSRHVVHRLAGPQPPQIGHDQMIEVRSGMEFQTSPA